MPHAHERDEGVHDGEQLVLQLGALLQRVLPLEVRRRQRARRGERLRRGWRGGVLQREKDEDDRAMAAAAPPPAAECVVATRVNPILLHILSNLNMDKNNEKRQSGGRRG